jgi:nucleoside-diphosphate-sugar epimerase
MESSSGAAFVTGGSGFIGQALIRRLTGEGRRVRALARSDAAASKVEGAGAEAVRGDLDDVQALRDGAAGCEQAFHAAARLGEWGPWEEFERINVQGTRNTVDACREAGVRRFVHVGTEAAVIAGEPLHDADESVPLRPDSKAYYCSSKAMAEQVVRDGSHDGLETVVVRPRFVWGPGDTTLLPGIAERVRQGQFAWVGGGKQLTSVSYIDNVIEGLMAGAERGRPGEAYFVTDGPPVVFREFLTKLLATQGVDPPSRTLPLGVAKGAAAACETIWRRLPLKGEPPVTRTAIWLSALEVTIDISKARGELGYEPRVTTEQGLERLAAESGARS